MNFKFPPLCFPKVNPLNSHKRNSKISPNPPNLITISQNKNLGSLPKSQMGRKPIDSETSKLGSIIVVFLGIVSCTMVFLFMSSVFRPSPSSISENLVDSNKLDGESRNLGGGESGDCCKGIEHVEYWGDAVKWGSEFKFTSSEECCRACKKMCTGTDGPCLCDSWVFCGNREACGSRFGECWLMKQKDTLAPDRMETGNKTLWTSGLVFGKGEGIIGMETEYGTLRIKLLPECSPHSVSYILDVLALTQCIGCQFYRAEGRGELWDSRGNHIEHASLGPPYALIQGTLDAQGTPFVDVPTEFCPTVKRGSVAWIGSGPEFFISLANHEDWKNSFTVFGSVLPEDMAVAEKISELPTNQEVWNKINVAVLKKPVSISLARRKSSGGVNLSSD